MINFARCSSILIITLCCNSCLKLYSQENVFSKKQAAELVVKNAVLLKLSGEDIKESIVSDAYYDRCAKVNMVYLQEAYKGIPVHNATRALAFKNEKLVSFTREFIGKTAGRVNVPEAIPAITPAAAVLMATGRPAPAFLQKVAPVTVLKTADLKTDFGTLGIARENIIAKLLWMPDKDGRLKLCWQVEFAPLGSSDYWLINVDATTGITLSKYNLTKYEFLHQPAFDENVIRKEIDSGISCHTADLRVTRAPDDAVTSAAYRVIPFPYENIDHAGGVRTLVNNPWENAGISNPATSLGWHNDGTVSHDSTRGNNVWAREDTAGNNGLPRIGAAAVSTTSSPSLTFDFPFNSAASPLVPFNQKAAVTQLFYWNNIMHDLTYQYGFDEPAGNFQNSNLGRGGAENDYIVAEAQDGNGIDNANFVTTVDGSRPRMQMYLWRPPSRKILHINSPVSLSGYKTARTSDFSSNNLLATVGPVSGNVILYDTASTGDSLACNALAGTPLSGRIALVYRGSCSFTSKVKNAQDAGATGVIVVNDTDGELFEMGGSDNSITIPAVMISQADGDLINMGLQNGETINVTLQETNLDGDLDNGIIAHEYTHGISTRLTGGPSTASCLQNREQMGEGWSDYFALMLTTNWSAAQITDGAKRRTIGGYVSGDDTLTGTGLRKYPYSTDKNIDKWIYEFLADSTDGESHTIGEIWATVLWDMTWNIIAMEGINPNLYDADATGGNSVALKLVTEGLKLQACLPGFLDGRDAILKADTILYGGRYSCAIWKAFAGRGMGVNAKQGSTDIYTDQVADYTATTAVVKKSADKMLAAQNDEITYTLEAGCRCGPVTNYKIIDTLASNVTYVSGGNYNSSNRTVSFNIPLLNNSEIQTFTVKVRVNNGTFQTPDTLLYETIPLNEISPEWTEFSTNPHAAEWEVSNTYKHSGRYSFRANDPDDISRQTLTAGPFLVTGVSTLSFWHYFNTEETFDGGAVQISVDNGLTWQDAGPHMVLNGYNNVRATDNTSLWFSGKSDSSFIQTVIDLSSYHDQNIKIRFVFTSDQLVGEDGWYIDDIILKNEAGVYNIGQLFNAGNEMVSRSDTIIRITSVPLPLAWGTFTAQKQGMAALLKWNTKQQHNTDRFMIERSADALHFSVITMIRATGENAQYSITDSFPLEGANYYRIRAVDKDGAFIYSEVQSLDFNELKNIVTVMPNPAKDKITIIVTGNRKRLQAQLINNLGQIAESFVISGERTQYALPKNATGMYYLKITGDKITYPIQKLLIKGM